MTRPRPLQTQMARLFRLKYLKGMEDPEELAEQLGVSQGTVRSYESQLKQHLTSKLGEITPERISFMCPECLSARMFHDPETGERSCTECGLVIEVEQEMGHRLPIGETYALENPLVFNKSLGTKVTSRSIMRVLARVRNNKEKVEAVRQIVLKNKAGNLTAVEAAREVRDILVEGGSEDIAEIMTEAEDPEKIANEIVNMFDAIPIRQITTLHNHHEPPIIRTMKQQAERLRWRSGLPERSDGDLFSVKLGYLIERVGREAALDRHLRHNPKDLAAACFVKTVKKLNPKMGIQGLSFSQEAYCFVDHVDRMTAKR